MGVGSWEKGGAARDAWQRLRKLLRRQECHLIQCGQTGYQQWVRESLEAGGGALHRLTKTRGEPLQELAPELDDAGHALVEPIDIVNSKAARWGTFWEVTDTPEIPQWREPLLQGAARQGRDEITTVQLEAALKCFGRRSGLGTDQQNPRWWTGLPPGSEVALIGLLENIEEQLVWPTPMLLNVVQLIHNSVESDKPITLTQS